SLGVVYGAATQFLGQRVYRDEWKVMGLASYGTPRYADAFRKMIHCTGDGWFRLDLDYFNFQLADKDRWYSPRWFEVFGPPRRMDEPVEQDRFADLAASVQLVLEETALHIVRHMTRRNPCRTLCLAGGVCLNSVMNARILQDTDIDELFIQPAASDPGAALGAALYVHHHLQGHPREWVMHHASFGPGYSDDDCLMAIREAGLACDHHEDITVPVVDALARGEVVGWFQGRMEFGPRALGNRSILADPRRAEMKDTINAKVKYREGYRPFAPAVLEERSPEYFTCPAPSPFMLLVFDVRPEKRSEIPAVTHVDGTGRLQTVSREHSPLWHKLISRFGEETGVPVILNTSFNIKGEPIVCTPRDAIRCFRKTGLDSMALGRFIVRKEDRA
ncbi:MAG: carbamoyltransferase, partial [Chitinivibrionales bacterium]|nr:carbamoyltransferase [Chitinivibrionales bacterium]